MCACTGIEYIYSNVTVYLNGPPILLCKSLFYIFILTNQIKLCFYFSNTFDGLFFFFLFFFWMICDAWNLIFSLEYAVFSLYSLILVFFDVISALKAAMLNKNYIVYITEEYIYSPYYRGPYNVRPYIM